MNQCKRLPKPHFKFRKGNILPLLNLSRIYVYLELLTTMRFSETNTYKSYETLYYIWRQQNNFIVFENSGVSHFFNNNRLIIYLLIIGNSNRKNDAGTFIILIKETCEKNILIISLCCKLVF